MVDTMELSNIQNLLAPAWSERFKAEQAIVAESINYSDEIEELTGINMNKSKALHL